MVDLPLPPEEMQYPKGKDFLSGGRAVSDQLVHFGGLKPEDRVLDVGCGIGRVARHLTDYTAGEYEGFDIVPSAIEWCRSEITSRCPNFHFAVADLQNGKYNPEGEESAANYRWPYEDGSFDFVFLASVFTHMLPDGAENYVRQAARVLKPGGRVFATYFLLNEESRRLMKTKDSVFDFSKRVGPGCFTAPGGRDERAIAYAEKPVKDLYAANSLTLIGVRYGSWCRPVADYHQDVILASRS